MAGMESIYNYYKAKIEELVAKQLQPHRFIFKVKPRLVCGWVTIYYSEFSLCLGNHVKPLVLAAI